MIPVILTLAVSLALEVTLFPVGYTTSRAVQVVRFTGAHLGAGRCAAIDVEPEIVFVTGVKLDFARGHSRVLIWEIVSSRRKGVSIVLLVGAARTDSVAIAQSTPKSKRPSFLSIVFDDT